MTLKSIATARTASNGITSSRTFGRADLTAAWVADMDFRTAPTIQKALVEACADTPIYGYTGALSPLDEQAECGCEFNGVTA